MDACCPSGGSQRHEHTPCSLPAACPSTGCAAVFLSFVTDCGTILPTMLGVPADHFSAFATSCGELTLPPGPPVPDDDEDAQGNSPFVTLLTYSIPGLVLVGGYCLKAELQRGTSCIPLEDRATKATDAKVLTTTARHHRVRMTSCYDGATGHGQSPPLEADLDTGQPKNRQIPKQPLHTIYDDENGANPEAARVVRLESLRSRADAREEMKAAHDNEGEGNSAATPQLASP